MILHVRAAAIPVRKEGLELSIFRMEGMLE
jgi:hypothetical protein